MVSNIFKRRPSSPLTTPPASTPPASVRAHTAPTTPTLSARGSRPSLASLGPLTSFSLTPLGPLTPLTPLTHASPPLDSAAQHASPPFASPAQPTPEPPSPATAMSQLCLDAPLPLLPEASSPANPTAANPADLPFTFRPWGSMPARRRRRSPSPTQSDSDSDPPNPSLPNADLDTPFAPAPEFDHIIALRERLIDAERALEHSEAKVRRLEMENEYLCSQVTVLTEQREELRDRLDEARGVRVWDGGRRGSGGRSGEGRHGSEGWRGDMNGGWGGNDGVNEGRREYGGVNGWRGYGADRVWEDGGAKENGGWIGNGVAEIEEGAWFGGQAHNWASGSAGSGSASASGSFGREYAERANRTAKEGRRPDGDKYKEAARGHYA